MPTSRPLPVLRPDRLRRIPRSFAWLDHRLRSHGILQELPPSELAFYVFLVLAGDAQGLSCWRLDRIERALCGVDTAGLHGARERLVERDLVAFRPWHARALDGSYQVLALPAQANRNPGLEKLGALLQPYLASKHTSLLPPSQA
jgi:hypothetical protein